MGFCDTSRIKQYCNIEHLQWEGIGGGKGGGHDGSANFALCTKLPVSTRSSVAKLVLGTFRPKGGTFPCCISLFIRTLKAVYFQSVPVNLWSLTYCTWLHEIEPRQSGLSNSIENACDELVLYESIRVSIQMLAMMVVSLNNKISLDVLLHVLDILGRFFPLKVLLVLGVVSELQLWKQIFE